MLEALSGVSEARRPMDPDRVSSSGVFVRAQASAVAAAGVRTGAMVNSQLSSTKMKTSRIASRAAVVLRTMSQLM